jgi:hypothetical protein
MLAAILLAASSQGCSRSEPPPTDVAVASEPPAKAWKTGNKARKTGKKAGKETAKKETANTLEAAEKACKEETKRKGIASVVGIFSRLRPGSADEDYRACMKGRGFEVKS